MDKVSDVIKWLELIKDTYGDLYVLKEEDNGIYTDLAIVITKEGIRFKYRYLSENSKTGSKEKIILGPIVEIF